MREMILTNVFDLEAGAELEQERAQASFDELGGCSWPPAGPMAVTTSMGEHAPLEAVALS